MIVTPDKKIYNFSRELHLVLSLRMLSANLATVSKLADKGSLHSSLQISRVKYHTRTITSELHGQPLYCTNTLLQKYLQDVHNHVVYVKI